MKNNLKEIGIVIQGYSTSKTQLQDVIDFYYNVGIVNIVVSSYSQCIDSNNIVPVILNDKVPGIRLQGDDISSMYNNKKPTGLLISVDADFPNPSFNNINHQLLTTKRGINCMYESFPNVNFILKTRADVKINNIIDYLSVHIEKIKASPIENDIFQYKILKNSYNRTPWNLNDYHRFGYKDDIKKYYSVKYVTGRIKAETYLGSAYILSQHPKISWDDAKTRYFVDEDFRPDITWYKQK